MYAVIKSGGKQYRVAPGQILKLETLPQEVGQAFTFDEVLMLANDEGIFVGKPLLETARVNAEVLGHGRNKKVHILKFRRRKHYMKRQGHRQNYTAVKITAMHA